MARHSSEEQVLLQARLPPPRGGLANAGVGWGGRGESYLRLNCKRGLFLATRSRHDPAASRSSPRPHRPRARIPSRVAQVVPESPPPRFPTGLILSEDRWLQLSGFNKNRSVPRLAGSPPGRRQRREGKRKNERPEGTDPRCDLPCVYHQEAQPVPLHKTLVFSPCAGIEVATDVLLWAFSPSPDPMQHQTPRDHHPPQHRRHGAPGVL